MPTPYNHLSSHERDLLAVLRSQGHTLRQIARIIQPPLSYPGGVLILGGISLNIWAAGLFRRKGTTIKPFETSSTLDLNLLYHCISSS